MKQQGFTLIELMIVVAIIGILAAVAIPQYQNYVINSKLSAAASSVSSIELAMANDYQSNGTFPTSQQLAQEGFAITNPANGDTIAVTGGATGQITYTFANQIGTGVPANSYITFSATPPAAGGGSSLSWVAAPSASIVNASAVAYINQKLNGS